MWRHRVKRKRKCVYDEGKCQTAEVKIKKFYKKAKFDNHFSNKDYGRLVWGKIMGSRTWPGMIVPYYDCGMRTPPADRAWVFWFGDNRVSHVLLDRVLSFKKNFKAFYAQTNNPTFERGITDCIKELQHQSGLLLNGESKENIIKWANEGFPGAADYENNADHEFSSKVKKVLSRIKKAQLRDHSSASSDSFFPVTSSSSSSDSDSSDANERRKWRPKASLLKSARNGKCDIEGLCIACDRTDCEIKAPHPYFVGGVCEHCKIEVDQNIKDLEAGLDLCCMVCASPGKSLMCDSPHCERVYCCGCVELLVSPSAVNTIERTSPWYCFLCEPFNPHTHGILKPRPEWREKIPLTWNTSWMNKFKDEETPDPSTFPKRPLRVLSAFDGIGTGLLALDKLGLEVEVYYCSEMDEAARNVVSLNFGPRVTFLSEVEKLTTKEVKRLCPIDLFIGGSPCNDLSYLNPLRKGLFDFSGSGSLFFYFYKILKSIQEFNKETHLFWMFENVKNMPRSLKAQISFFLGKQAVVIDARYFSPQSRPRCFWGNIPGISRPVPPQLEHYYKLNQYINKVNNRRAVVDKVNCITTNPASLRLGYGEDWPIKMNGHGDILWATEIEKIFGLPPHYTDTGNLSLRERQVLLGRAWSVPVIHYIFQPLCQYFPCKKDASESMELKTPEQEESEEPKASLRDERKAALNEESEGVKAALNEESEGVKAALNEESEGVKAALNEDSERVKAALNEESEGVKAALNEDSEKSKGSSE